MDILNKIKEAKLVGRGGACFPTATKWSMVHDAPGKEKYIVCNAAEGEPGIKKDGFLLEKYPERVIDGINIAIKFLKAKKAIIYINERYYKKYSKNLLNIIGNKKIEFFIKPHGAGYIGGEESTILNAIEGKRLEPRIRPPFPTNHGFFGVPTLINNVETLYNVSLVVSDDYEKTRFFTINGDCLWTGVYEYPESYSVEKILKETNNYPKFPFFVQIGGDGSGEVLNEKQLKRKVTGAGSITIYSIMKHQPKILIKNWFSFFMNESCGQCTPCREGTFRLVEIINSRNPDWNLVSDLLLTLDDTAFCGLGCAVSIPIRSFINNVLPLYKQNKIILKGDKKKICECF